MNPAPANAFGAGVVPGVLSGIAGLLAFLGLHHLWIAPIWFVLPFGVVVAGLGGIAVQRSYDTLRAVLPARPWTAPALVGLVAVILLPSFVLAELRPTLFDISGPQATLAVSPTTVTAVFVLELLVVTALTGGMVGWVVGRTRAAAMTTAVAGFVLALGPGHNIPLIGGTPGVATEVGLLTAAVVVAAVTLVEVDATRACRVRHRLHDGKRIVATQRNPHRDVTAT